MQTTFDIVNYTGFSNLETYLEKKEEEAESLKTSKSTIKPSTLFWTAGIILVFILLSSKEREIALLVLSFLGIMWLITQFLAPKEPQIRFRHFGEKIHFTEQGIRLKSSLETQNAYFLYEEISNFCLTYHGFLKDRDIETTFFSWEKEETEYKYAIRINNSNQKESLIHFLKYLYDNEYSFTELDKKGNFSHLLNTSEVEKEEQMPLQTKTNIEEKYQKLIDQIGMKEEERNNNN